MKTILVELDTNVAGRLTCATELARTFEGHVIGMQVTPAGAFVSFDPFGGIHAIPSVLAALAEREQEIREIFETAMADKGVSAEYRQSDGPPAELIAEQSKVADLVIVAKPGEEDDRPARLSHVGNVVLASSAPVLAVPPGTQSIDAAGTAIIAWNGSPEAANAVRSALPLLARASTVTVLEARETGGKWDMPAAELAAYLARHGINVQVETLELSNDVPSSLVAAVAERKPAYLVMGAYGRSRAREWLLGGVTRSMILDLPLPLLLAH